MHKMHKTTAKHCKRFLVMLLVSCLFSANLYAPMASAEPVTTAQLAQQDDLTTQRDQIKAFLAREEVRQQLLDQGVPATQIEQRVNAMTDQEVRGLYQRIDDLPAGGSILGIALGLIVIFILLDMAGATDVFPDV
ncbi:MAG: PA2779 family protein [Gammaproteobacteria bacterium]|nr:PA2779 family protein [Pseudomonadales bacterium]MCP5347975.1 PA2779 family protein [Pseudomonadales bacterium]